MNLPLKRRDWIGIGVALVVLVVFAYRMGADGSGPSPQSSPIQVSSPTPSPSVEPSPVTESTEEPTEVATQKAPTKKAPKKSVQPKLGEAPAKFTGVHASNYEDAFAVCGAVGVKEVARQFGTARDPVSAAEGYASGYRPAFRQAPFEGCLDGFGAR
jgi:hypothetical protein